jgi:hypothetical protein
MSTKIIIGAVAFGAGIFVGIQIAKAYAQNVIKSDIHDALPGALQGGIVESVADKIFVPQ